MGKSPDEVPPIRGNTVVIGKCARPHRDGGVFVPGCPPHGMKIADAACDALGVDRETMHRAVKALHDF